MKVLCHSEVFSFTFSGKLQPLRHKYHKYLELALKITSESLESPSAKLHKKVIFVRNSIHNSIAV